MSIAPTVVVDTNVVVAAGFRPASDSARVVGAIRRGALRAVWSDETRRETERVVTSIPPLSPDALVGLFREEDRHAGPADPAAFPFVPDPGDRKFAALAAATGATLITMDEHLLGVRERIDAPVDTPGAYLARLGAAPRFAGRMARLDTEDAIDMGARIAAAEAAGQRVIRCNIGEPDFPLPDHVREEIERQLRAGRTRYVEPQGILPLREAVADQVSATRGIPVSPDRVVVFPGPKFPIGLCQQAYCDPGDEVIYPSPGFVVYESFTGFTGARAVPLHLREGTGFAVTADDLEPLLSPRTRLLYLNSPANPTGAVLGPDHLERIADLLLRKAPPGLRVFSDEIYEHVLFDGTPHRSLASLPGMAERTIVVSGVSKGFAWTGGRVGWAVFPTAREAAVFRRLNINYFSCLPEYNQLGAVAALRSPESAPAVAAMVAAFQQRRDLVLERLRALDGLSCHRPQGAFYLFPNVSGVCERLGAVDAWEALPEETRRLSSPATLLKLFLLYRYGVATLERRSFGRIGAEGKHYLRLSIATGLDDLREATDRLARAAADRDGFADFVAGGGALL